MSAMRYPNPTPAPGRAGSGPASVAAAIAAGTRPDFPFPNPEAKTASADGTAPARVWESRTPPPTQTHKRGGPAPRAPPFVCPTPADTPADTQHTGHTRTQSIRTHHTPTPANRASPHSHNPNPTAQRTEGNQTGLARTDPLTPQPHTRKHTRRPMRQGT